MSNRQKSFFDQDHSGKSNAHWHGNQRNGYQKSHSYNAHPTATRPAIAASSQARSKLSAYQLPSDAAKIPAKSPGKENRVRSATQSPTRKSAIDESDMSVGAQALSYLPPSTPAVRLPLADLLGNGEDTRRRVLEKEASPEDQLAWVPNHSMSPVHGRKRAHSSSPVTSSQNETSGHFGMRKPLDLEQIQLALKTPKADPAADLWSRYNSNNENKDAISAKLPSLAYLLDDSSPQSLPRTPGGSVSGLRRWASCGNEWPATKHKRRKVHTAVREELEAAQVNVTSETSHVSRLGAMVDRVRANLAKPKIRPRIKEPSSSSPLPEKGSFEGLGDASPVGNGYTRPWQVPPPAFGEAVEIDSKSLGAKDTSESSDYGDDNIDLTQLAVDEEIPAPAISASGQHLDPNAQDSGYRDDETCEQADANEPQFHTGSIHQLPSIEEEEADEFDDGNDLTAEDLEVAFSQIPHASLPAQQPTAIATHTSSNVNQIRQEEIVKPANQSYGVLSDDEEFGGVDFDDEQFDAAEIAATQAFQASSKSTGSSISTKSRKIQRYLVKNVVSGTYVNERGLEQEEKVLVVEDEKRKSMKAVTLRQSWLDTHCNPGAYVHVVGHFSNTGQITIDDAANLLVVHPDHLVSATAVADSFDCLRKAVLQDRVKATNQTNKPIVYGSILHELFQIAMQHNRWDLDWLNKQVRMLVVKYIEGLFEAGAKNTVEAVEVLSSKMPELSDWAGHFVRASPDRSVKAKCRNGKTLNLSVTKLLDVEEHVWSPTYGLKGNIDATVEVTMEDDSGLRRLTVPFEVKTGKHQSAAHQAQTALYTLLLSDRYDINIQYGLLYYMENSTVNRIPAIRNELRHMVMQRNELASYVRERRSLPPMLKNEHKCGRCYAKTSCFLYHKLSEDGTPETAGVGNKFLEVVAKLQPEHQGFFKKWDHLLTKEETEMFKFRRELWTMLSTERERLGRCFSEVVIEAGSAHEERDAQKINRFAYTFLKQDPRPGTSFTESQIVVGEPIVISSEKGHFALANGYVTKVSAHRISVAVDRRLHNARIRQPGFDEDTNQAFAAIMEVDVRDVNSSMVEDDGNHRVVYRLDKDEFSNGMATVRNNLLAIMDDDVFRAIDLRKMIIEGRAPQFKPAPTAYTLSGPASQMQINSDQRAAIDKIMSAQDYALVLGMPGTGKTTTIAHIIRALVARGKSVLLTSYTHTAVDNILLKLRDSSISVLRLGVQAKIHPEVQEFANLAAVPRQSIEELEETYMTPQVVATTCLGINHQIFHKRPFDYCIVDEASQITLPVCLGPIRMARTFVLVGDHYQLPPLVQNKEAQEGGLDISLFKLLSDRQPSSVVNLEHQYRMCADVMHLSNTLIYSGRLKCGNETVANRTLEVPTPQRLARFHSSPACSAHLTPSQRLRMCPSELSEKCMLSAILDPSRKVIFADTDKLAGAHESLSGQRITNPAEVDVLHLLSSALLAQGITPAQTGIITFYRSQLALLRQTLKHTSAEAIEMHTADKFQGRDKEVVLLSCVRSNKDGNVGDLLRDWRRVNVAITRARSKFIIVGSRKTLQGDELWKKLIAAVDDMDGTVTLDESFVEGHRIDDGLVVGSSAALDDMTGVRVPPGAGKDGVLGEKKGIENRGVVKKAPRQGKVGKDLLLKKRPVSQDIMNMIVQ